MDVRRLAVLRELADRGSLAAAAQALHLTPSAVSQQLKALEREAGLPLTERHGRGLALTGAGRALADTATDLAVAIARAEAVWQDYTEQPVGEVSLTTFPTAGAMLLPGLLRRVAATPGLVLRCTDQDPQLPDFVDLTSDFDVVVADAPEVPRSWRERRLAIAELLREPLDVALPEGHPLARLDALRPAQVVDEDWIGVPEGFPYDRILERVEIATGRTARVLQRFVDNGIVEAMVAAGHGIAILPRYTTRATGSGIVTRPLRGIESERVIWAIMRPDRAIRPSVRAVVDALRAEAARYTP